LITTKEAGLRTGKAHRTIRLWCLKGKLNCKKIGKNWYVDESSLNDVLEVKVIGKNYEAQAKGKETDTFIKSLDLPPYYVLSQRIGYLEGKLEMLERENTLLKEQLTYQKTSWIRKLFKR